MLADKVYMRYMMETDMLRYEILHQTSTNSAAMDTSLNLAFSKRKILYQGDGLASLSSVLVNKIARRVLIVRTVLFLRVNCSNCSLLNPVKL